MSFLNFEKYTYLERENVVKSCIGGNQKEIFIVLAQEDYIEEVEFLKKVLSSVQIELEKDCSILSIQEGEKVIISQLFNQIPSKQVLIFGIRGAELGLNFDIPLYHPVIIQKRTFLLGDSLHFLDRIENKESKLKLWNALKSIFLNSVG